MEKVVELLSDARVTEEDEMNGSIDIGGGVQAAHEVGGAEAQPLHGVGGGVAAPAAFQYPVAERPSLRLKRFRGSFFFT